MKSIRCSSIFSYVEAHGFAKTSEICALFPDVSVMTIHRDLDFLAEKGLVERVRGGAKAVSRVIEPRFEAREFENSEHKRLIAKKAVSLIKENMTIFLDAGTTSMELARIFPDIDVNVFTTGPNIALELMKKKNPQIFICGGCLNRSNLSLSGSFAADTLEKVNLDIAFIGISGYDGRSGFTGGKENEAAVKALAIKKSAVAVAMMDKTKFSRVLPYTFAQISDFGYIVTDSQVSEEFFKTAENYGVVIL